MGMTGGNALQAGQMADLRFDPTNANKGTVRGRGMLERSLQQYGAGRAPVASADGVILAGNKTIEVARELGIPVQEIESDGTTLYVIRRTDLPYDDPRAKELAIADNRSGEISLEWDADVLAAFVEDGIDLDQFWFPEELDELLNGDDEPMVGLTDPDDVPDIPDDPITKPGDVWLLGEHRVMCGDSTVVADVDRLMAGRKADMVFTDPPYALFGNSTGVSGITDDKMVRPFFLEVFKQCRSYSRLFAHVYVCCDWHSAFSLQDMATRASLTAKNLCIWDKGDGGVGAMYQHCYEMVWFFANSPIATGTMGKVKTGERVVQGKPNVWRFGRELNGRLHNAQKPVEMIAFAIDNSSDSGDIVLDLFGGSGSTLIAAEQANRTAYLMDTEPKWCDVIVRRWEDFTGNTATRETPALHEAAG